MSVTISQIDKDNYLTIRDNVNSFLRYVSSKYAMVPGKLLDIAPQIHVGAANFFNKDIDIQTFDIDKDSGCTYIGDICTFNSCIKQESFDYIVFTEVLEHTLNPFKAIEEIERILKSGGYLFLSVPFNFRIHGPLPDCWRFTEHGLRALLSCFSILELNSLETAGRDLMPIHYTVVAQKYSDRITHHEK